MKALAWLYALVVGTRHAWWLNTHRGPWPVSRFDAVGDGVHDDTRPLQRALHWVKVRGGGEIIIVSTHRITGTLRG